MQGLILINAYPNGEKFIRQGERIAQELRALGVPTDVLRNGEVYATIYNGEIDVKLPKKYDFIVYFAQIIFHSHHLLHKMAHSMHLMARIVAQNDL